MIRTAAASIALALIAVPAAAALQVGAKAPDFSTQVSLAGKPMPFALAKALKKGPVVLYFYPAAFTKGCTIEAHDFAEATDDFAKMGATVIGMSADPIDKLNQFSVSECRNKFAVGSATPETIQAYDVVLPVKPNISNRTSYVIAPDGKVIFAYSAMDPAGHVTGTMDAVKQWRASHPMKGD
ncbi:peroxiredoxin [Sphingomonas nostoxanthinifaciens]|uniref:peroxiredoxin n=1 Tax=Sphingomonas nostoxanthinifaciens TaxID=2872652 RepID=UPI001CC21785|nr:peroxiredoxin [Sphingomonas nostoxanthinifaciens]UAK24837.1 peroxiredoxin [Sphingomonas nostoxanthinifaciens]